ncbi:MAG TPA: hypothetical protein VFV02_15145 [Acidimicrobiales bacterium]|nr:hypothetical protein [Acidimicrobiales bacterium]
MSHNTETDAMSSLRRAMHRLWVDHVVWTREYVVSAIDGHPDAEPAARRLLKNQEDIGNAVAGFYGQEAGTALTDLLKQHILIAVDLVDAAVKGDKERFASEDKRWDANAAEIARFLSAANPFWPQKEIQDLLSLHLTLTRREAVARLNKAWDEDIAAFDDILTEILTLADALTDGIVHQFPEQFRTNGHRASWLHRVAAAFPGR